MRSRRQLAAYKLELSDDGSELIYTYDTKGERTGITSAARATCATPASASTTSTPTQSSLEDIFVRSGEERT